MIAMGDALDTFRIVVGCDGSDAARRGLVRARQLAARQLLVVVVAVEPEVRSAGLGSELTGQTVATGPLLEEARALLAGEERIVIETRAAVGDPAAVLIDAAREWGAELVIVGRRGGDFVARTLLGSVSERVVQHAHCDVLVVA
jgi:nucleotide-binding universal stress UspA family protein